MSDPKCTQFDDQWLALQPWQTTLLLAPCRCGANCKLEFTRPGSFPAVVCTACDYGVVADTIEAVVLRHNRDRAAHGTTTPQDHFPVAAETLRYAVALLVKIPDPQDPKQVADELLKMSRTERLKDESPHGRLMRHAAEAATHHWAEISQAASPTDKAVTTTESLDEVIKAVKQTNSWASYSEMLHGIGSTAPNCIEWCRGHQWLNYDLDLFARQVQVMIKFFEDACYFCSDVDYIHDVPVGDTPDKVLAHYALLQHGRCPKCRRNRFEILHDWVLDPRHSKFNQPVRELPPNEFVGIWGQRSGANTTTALMFTYILHRLFTLPDPTGYFGLPDDAVLQMSLVAQTTQQAVTTLWTPFTHAWDRSPWVKKVTRLLVAAKQPCGPLYRRGETYMAFPAKHLVVHARDANIAKIRGTTHVAVAVDNFGYMDNGVEVFTALNNSLQTVRAKAQTHQRVGQKNFNTLDGYMINISSPRDAQDPIEQRAALAATSPRMYFTRFPTWEVNHRESEKALREEFADDKASVFSRDFGAQVAETSPAQTAEKDEASACFLKTMNKLDEHFKAQALRNAKAALSQMTCDQVVNRLSYQNFGFVKTPGSPEITDDEYAALARDRLWQLDEQKHRVEEKKVRKTKPLGVKTAVVKKPTRTKKSDAVQQPTRWEDEAKYSYDFESLQAEYRHRLYGDESPGTKTAVVKKPTRTKKTAANKAKPVQAVVSGNEADLMSKGIAGITESKKGKADTLAVQTKLRKIAGAALTASKVLVKAQTQVIKVLYREQGYRYLIVSQLGQVHDFTVTLWNRQDQQAVFYAMVPPCQDHHAVLVVEDWAAGKSIGATGYGQHDLRPSIAKRQIPAEPTLASIAEAQKNP